MLSYQDLFYAALNSRLSRLKIEAKALRRTSQIAHHEALDQIAASLGCRDWQHLTYTTQNAFEAYIIHTADFDLTDNETKMLMDMDLRALYQERQDIALLAIQELAVELFKEIFDTIRSPSVFAKRAANFGDHEACLDEKNAPGWRLRVDVPGGFLFYGQYPDAGKLVALVDGSVPYEVVLDYLQTDPEADEEDLVAEAREHYRSLGVYNIILDGCGYCGEGVTASLVEACYEAIKTSVDKQCKVAW